MNYYFLPLALLNCSAEHYCSQAIQISSALSDRTGMSPFIGKPEWTLPPPPVWSTAWGMMSGWKVSFGECFDFFKKYPWMVVVSHQHTLQWERGQSTKTNIPRQTMATAALLGWISCSSLLCTTGPLPPPSHLRDLARWENGYRIHVLRYSHLNSAHRDRKVRNSFPSSCGQAGVQPLQESRVPSLLLVPWENKPSHCPFPQL